MQSEAPKADAPLATGDYHDAQRAILRNMYRLKALRLAREAVSVR